MPSRNPPSREGQLWLQRFNQGFQAWLQSGRARDDLLLSAAQDLERLLERCPEYAAEVHGIALTTCFNARTAAAPATVAAIARTGALADAMLLDESSGRRSARVLLYLFQAEADLQRHARHDGFAAVSLVDALLAEAPVEPALAPYLDGFRWFLRGALAELALDTGPAANAYDRAGAVLDPLLADPERLVSVSIALVRLLFGDAATASPMAQQVLMLAANQVRILVARNALHRARVRAMTGRLDNALAAELWAIVQAGGIPDDVGPIDLAPLVAALDEATAGTAAALLVERIGGARQQSGDWDAVLHAALLASPLAACDAATGWSERLGIALGSITDALAYAFTCSRILLSLPPEVDRAPFATAFVDAVRELLAAPDRPLDDLRVRALFDGALARAVQWARDAFELEPVAARRAQFALLLDALRGVRLPRLPAVPLGENVEYEEPTADLAAALLLASDRLQRVARALHGRPDALALILQQHEDGCLFTCVSGHAPLALVDADAAFSAACDALASALDEDVGMAEVTGDLPSGDRIERLGAAAFAALPEALQRAVRSHSTLLFVPDFRGAIDRPIELLHDGQQFLGTSHVIARFPSVHALTRAVEQLSRRTPHRRALVLAAAHVEGWDELPLSRAEVATVQQLLAQAGWDAPAIVEERLSAEFVMERLPLVAHAHIAAHGHVAGDEALVLPAGSRLTVDHLLKRRLPHLPLVFLNTCSLGQTRYVGAGISRGIAHTLLEAGAPACVANLLPVEDAAASDLALQFYREAVEHPCGEALRRARSRLATDGLHPMLWGSTVLLGDPWIPLEPGEAMKSITDRLLDAYFSLEPDDGEKETLWLEAQEQLLEGPEDPRLEAAVALIRLAADVPDLADPTMRERWVRIIQLADEIDHPAAMALTRAAQLPHDDDSATASTLLDRIDDAIHYIEPLAAAQEPWSRLLMRTRGDRARLLHRARGLGIQLHGAADAGEEAELRNIMVAITDAQATQEAAAGKAGLIQPERTTEDILWNAIVIGHGNRFEDAREAIAFAEQLAVRLERKHALPAAARPLAVPVLGGLLFFLWRSQNAAWLAPEMADGWSNTIAVATAELARDFTDADPRWLEIVRPFASRIDAALARIEALSWENVYQHLDAEAARLRLQAEDRIAEVAREAPARLAMATAWIMGTVMQRNTFSPLDGSVPEDIGKRLDGIYYALESQAEGRFTTWLQEGFRQARERPLDELQRWKLGIPAS